MLVYGLNQTCLKTKIGNLTQPTERLEALLTQVIWLGVKNIS